MSSFPCFTPVKHPNFLTLFTFNQTPADKTSSKPQPNLPFAPRTPQTEALSLSNLSSPISVLSPLGVFGNLSNCSQPIIGSQNPFAYENLGSPNREVVNFLVSWKLQQTLQSEVFNAQMQQLMDIRCSLVEQLRRQNSQESQLSQDLENQNQNLSSNDTAQLRDSKTVEKTEKLETKEERSISDQKKCSLSNYKKGSIKSQIQNLVEFILENFGRVSEKEFEDEKSKYKENPGLVEVFEILMCKYGSTVKTKEEMVKYVLRRALKFIKSDLKKKTNGSSRNVSKTMLQYFKVPDEALKLTNEDELLKEILPFRKNSKNKTMNTSFIVDMFSSESFRKDYESYLQKFGDILDADNHSKLEKLIGFIEECVAKKKIHNIKNYKRIPWPKLWIMNTKKIAQDLPSYNSQSPQTTNACNKKHRAESDCNASKGNKHSLV